MSNSKEDYRKIIEERIAKNSFNPNVTYDPDATYDDKNKKVIVNYYVDLPVEQRDRYLNGYYDADRTWVMDNDNDAGYGLCAGLYCGWQNR